MLISKIILKNKKNIILMYFKIKITLKYNRYHISKYTFRILYLKKNIVRYVFSNSAIFIFFILNRNQMLSLIFI